MPMFSHLFGQTRGAYKRASAFVFVLALVLSQTLSASLVQALTVDEISQGSVLGDTTYPSVRLTSTTNQSLTVMATPVSFANGKWTYKFDWTRVRNAQGSLYITLKSNKSTSILKIDTAAKTGSETAQLEPLTSYRFEFFSQTNGNGSVLLRKFFTTMGGLSGDTTVIDNGGAIGTGSMTGSYNPNVDKETTDRFYVSPAAKVKVPGKPAMFMARFGASNAIEGLPPINGNKPAYYSDNYYFHVEGLPEGAVVWYYTNNSSLANSGYPDWGTDYFTGTHYFNWDWTRPQIMDADGAVKFVNRIHPEITLMASLDYKTITKESVFKGYPVNQFPLVVEPGQKILVGIQNTPDFKGSGVYTLTGVLTKRTAGVTGTTPQVIKKVTFSVDMGSPAAECLASVKTRDSMAPDYTKPVAKSSNLYSPSFVVSEGTLRGFTDYCDPALEGQDATGRYPKQIRSTDTNFAALKTKMEACAQKAQNQANSLGISMKCGVKNFGSSGEAGFIPQNISIDGLPTNGYYAPVCNTINSGMPNVDWFATNLVGTGQTNTNLTSLSGWKGVELTDRFVAMEKKWGRNHGGYWDVDAGAYREGSVSTSYAVSPSCDAAMSVIPTIKTELAKNGTGVLGGETPGDTLIGLTGQQVTIKAQVPTSVKSATLYLMKNYEYYPSPTDLFYLGGDSARRYNLLLSDARVKTNILAADYKWQPPMVAQRIGTISFDANGKGSITWTLPDLGPEFAKSGSPYSSLTSAMEQIRMVADNGMWTDSLHFKIWKTDPNNKETVSQGCNPAADSSCGTVSQRPADQNDGTSVATPAGTYISRTFKAPSMVVVPSSAGVGNDWNSIYSNWNSLATMSKDFTAGSSVKIYAWSQNLFTEKVDIDIIDNNSNCPLDYSQSPSGYNTTCERNFANSTTRKTIRIAEGVSAVKTNSDYGNNWAFTYSFALPQNLAKGKYQIRLTDPAYLYGFLGQSKTDPIYPSGGGVGFSGEFTIK